jgi:excisionase family DNA binding protein
MKAGARGTGDQGKCARTGERCALDREVRKEREPRVTHADPLPIFLKPEEAADLLRTTRKAIYVMIERRRLPGARKFGKRILIRSAELIDFINQQATSSLQGEQR